MNATVLQLTPSYPPEVGGIEDHVVNLVERLPEHGYDPIVVTPRRTDGEPSGDPNVYRVKPALSIYKSRFAPGIVSKLFQLDYDLIHVHAPFHFALEFAALGSRLRSLPLVVTAHMYDARDSFLYQLYQSQVYDRCLDAATKIIPTTEDYVAGYPAFERNRHKITPVPLGVDVSRYARQEGSRSRLEFDENERILLFVGAMERHHFYKEPDLLIEAFAKSDLADRLLLVGSGDRVPALKRKAEMEGVADTVEFPGYVDDDELPAYYSAADLFVLPSKADRGEAFGIVLLEAMACGTPVIASDIPGVRSVVGSGGTTVPPGDSDALVRAIDQELRRAKENPLNPREHVVEMFSQSDIVARIADVYDSVR